MTTATKERATFSQSCTVSIDIGAPPARVWSLLTDAPTFPQWNSTVTRITGDISLGEELKIQVPISDRVFKVKVSEFVPERSMTWRDGAAPMFQGVRTYRLETIGSSTRFTMSERFAGLMLPMIRRTLPDFGPVFERYATDLKAASEASP